MEVAADEDLNVTLEGVRGTDGLPGWRGMMFSSQPAAGSCSGNRDHDAAWRTLRRLAVPVTGFFAEAEMAPLEGRRLPELPDCDRCGHRCRSAMPSSGITSPMRPQQIAGSTR